MKKIVSLVLVFSILFLSSCSSQSTKQQTNNINTQTEQTDNKNKAVDFTLKNIDGEEVKLSNYKGKTIVVNFFATWCPPCKAEFPGFVQTVDAYKSDDSVVFLFVNLGEDKATVNSFLKDRNYSLKPLLDEDGKVAAYYGVTGIPTTVIIDKEFNIFATHVGFMEKQDLKNYIEKVK